VKEIRGSSIIVKGTASFANGDGLCFLNREHQLEGFRVNRVEREEGRRKREDGRWKREEGRGTLLHLMKVPEGLSQGMALYRNNDQEFGRLLSKNSAERKIPVTMCLRATDDGYELQVIPQRVRGCGGAEVRGYASVRFSCEHQQANTPQRDYIIRQLTKLGGTPYTCTQVQLADDFNYFIPGSLLAQMRRQALAEIEKDESTSAPTHPRTPAPPHLPLSPSLLEGAKGRLEQEPLMQCRYCLRYALGFCVKHGGRRPAWHEPLCLRLGDGRRFRLEFDCSKCQMNVYAIPV
jgi:putative protease